MIPLIVQIGLRTAMVMPDRPIHLDALLAYTAVKIAQRFGEFDPLQAQESLPLERLGEGKDAIWKASQVHLELTEARFYHQYARRWDIDAWTAAKIKGVWADAKDDVPQGSGHMKGYLFVKPMAQVNRATAWCIGDRDAIEQMLRDELLSLGKNGRMGWGQISSIDVSPASPEESDFWRRRTLLRKMEDLKLPGHFLGTASTRPPYWDRSLWREAWEYDPGVPAAALQAA